MVNVRHMICTNRKSLFSSNTNICCVFYAFVIVCDATRFFLFKSIETVLYLNLRIGRESMNHQVLSGDVMNDAPPASRFRNDDPTATEFSQESLDYRHVPLMDDDDGKEMVFPNTSVV